MANGTAPQAINLTAPQIDPNTSVDAIFPFNTTAAPPQPVDLSPCEIDAYPADRFVFCANFAPIPFAIVNPADPNGTPANIQTLLSQLQAAQIAKPGGPTVAVPGWAARLPADFGILYLDQLRVRPAGTVIGEQVYTLGLGPLEKVTLTQTTYTKKTVSVDSLTDSSQETDYEFDSSFSTELASAIQNEQNSQSQQKLSVDAGLKYGPVSVGGSYSSSTSQGSRDTQSQSAKQSQQITQKASSKAKTEHRIEFKTETETGVENVAQRVFQNPNTAHTLMLNFYKVLQRHELYYERYGALMCWAPCIVDPGRSFRQAWTDKIAQKVIALSAVSTWIPDDLKTAPVAQVVNSGWVYVPVAVFAGWINSEVDNLSSGSSTGWGINLQTQIALPAGYELQAFPSQGHQVLPMGWPAPPPQYVDTKSIQSGPLQCEVATNLTQLLTVLYDATKAQGLNPSFNPQAQPNWNAAVTGPSVGTLTPSNGKGQIAVVSDGNPAFGPPTALPAAGNGLTFSDIPGDVSVPGSAPSSSASNTQPLAAAPTTVSWYVAISFPYGLGGLDWAPYLGTGANPPPPPFPFPYFAVRTTALAVPSDATVAAYNDELSTRRQAEYAARLADFQQSVTAAQAALADGATFDPRQELFRQLLGKALINTDADSRTCAYLESWRDAFAWDAASYVMTPCWMNPLLDYYDVAPGGVGGTKPLTQLWEVLSGFPSSADATGSSSTPYAAVVPPLWGNQPTTFATAASVQVFVPIVPGMELLAGRLISGGVIYDAAIQAFTADLAAYQQQSFGTVSQPPVGTPLVIETAKVLQLASWQELMPTNGTYVDAVLGDCGAADAYLIAQLQAQTNLRTAQANALASQVAVSPKAK